MLRDKINRMLDGNCLMPRDKINRMLDGNVYCQETKSIECKMVTV